MRTIGATLACTAALFALAACGERGEPVGLLPPDLPATVQGAGSEPFVAETVPDRVVVLDAGVAATAWELGANVVGATNIDFDPTIALVNDTAGQINVEAVRALTPDLIVATPETDEATVAALRQDPAVPIYVAPASSVDDVIRSAFELGVVLGDPVLAREFSASLRQSIDDVTRTLVDRDPVRVFVDTGFRVPPDPDSLFADVLERAGGVFVPEDAIGGSPVERDELLSAAPDAYLATRDSRVTLTSLQNDDRLSLLTAVRNERVFVIDRSELSVGGPDIVATLESLVAILHPDAG